MIRVNRGAEPGVLARNRRKWLGDWRKARTKQQKDKVLERYRKADVRDSLRDAFHGKCAYCESNTDVATWGHIEHYRPRNTYPERAFDWDNLLWSCPRCNSDCKQDRFPEAPDGGPPLDPCADEPSDHLVFDYDPIAHLANVYGKSTRGITTVDLLQLNRKELLAHRSQMVWRIAVLAEVAKQGNAKARCLLDAAKLADAPYAAFARALD
jgi:uncharacterized protein (TIGR02646 family)